MVLTRKNRLITLPVKTKVLPNGTVQLAKNDWNAARVKLNNAAAKRYLKTIKTTK